jgi:hypothetical protein
VLCFNRSNHNIMFMKLQISSRIPLLQKIWKGKTWTKVFNFGIFAYLTSWPFIYFSSFVYFGFVFGDQHNFAHVFKQTHLWVVLGLSQHLTVCHDCLSSHWNKVNLNQDTRINLGQCPNQAIWGKVKRALRF